LALTQADCLPTPIGSALPQNGPGPMGGWTENVSSHDLASLLRNSYSKGVLFDRLKNTSSLPLRLTQIFFHRGPSRVSPNSFNQRSSIEVVKLKSQGSSSVISRLSVASGGARFVWPIRRASHYHTISNALKLTTKSSLLAFSVARLLCMRSLFLWIWRGLQLQVLQFTNAPCRSLSRPASCACLHVATSTRFFPRRITTSDCLYGIMGPDSECISFGSDPSSIETFFNVATHSPIPYQC
jgi:hypothetical protein